MFKLEVTVSVKEEGDFQSSNHCTAVKVIGKCQRQKNYLIKKNIFWFIFLISQLLLKTETQDW